MKKQDNAQPALSSDVSPQALTHVILAFLTRIFLSQHVGDVESKMTVAQRKVLLILGVHGPMSMTEIARQEGVTLPAATALMDKLVALGYVERISSPNDRRVVLATPTPEGNAIIENLKQRYTNRLNEILKHLSVDERVRLLEAINTVADLFQRVPALSDRADKVSKTLGAGGRRPTRFKGDAGSTVGKKMSVAAIALSVACLFGGCGAKNGKDGVAEVEAMQNTASVAVQLITAQEHVVPKRMPVVGTLTANEDSKIAARVPGLVVARLVERGDAVTTGQVLVKLDTTVVQNNLDKATSQLHKLAERLQIKDPQAPFSPEDLPEVKSTIAEMELAKSTMDRNRPLALANSISQQDMDKMQTAYETARQRYLLARLIAVDSYNDYIVTGLTVRDLLRQISDMQIKAPFEGMVAEHSAKPGEFVKEGQDVVRLVSVNPLRLMLTIPEENVLSVKAGQVVEFNLPGEAATEVYTGTVTHISPAVDKASRSLTVEALVPNPTAVLRPGHFVKVQVVLDPNTKAVILPERAVKKIGESTVVYLDNNGTARETVVRAGDRVKGEVQIREGLKSGDRVILEADKAIEGVKVHEMDSATTAPVVIPSSPYVEAS